MDYHEETKKMLDKIETEDALRYIFIIVSDILKELGK